MPPARLAILRADERRAANAADLVTLRTGMRSRDPLTAILAIRAIGRLERPALVADLLPALNFGRPEVRTEAANAIGQAAQGWTGSARPAGAPDIGSILTSLILNLEDEDQASVRAALCETIGRLPYQTSDDVARAEAALLAVAERAEGVPDRLGVAKGLEALVRRQHDRRAPGAPALDTLRALAGADEEDDANGTADRLRDARVRRLALEALIIAGALDESLVVHTAADPDPQTRRLAMRAAAASGKGTGVLARGLQDATPMVRLEALRGFAARRDDGACDTFVAATRDAEPHVALVALDQLAVCTGHEPGVKLLESIVNDLSSAGAARGWHRAAHAIVALAAAAPARAAEARADSSPPRHGGSCASTPRARPPRCAIGSASRHSPPTPTTTSSKPRSKGCRRWPATPRIRCMSRRWRAPDIRRFVRPPSRWTGRRRPTRPCRRCRPRGSAFPTRTGRTRRIRGRRSPRR